MIDILHILWYKGCISKTMKYNYKYFASFNMCTWNHFENYIWQSSNQKNMKFPFNSIVVEITEREILGNITNQTLMKTVSHSVFESSYNDSIWKDHVWFIFVCFDNNILEIHEMNSLLHYGRGVVYFHANYFVQHLVSSQVNWNPPFFQLTTTSFQNGESKWKIDQA